jgi:hypothetical protein
MRLNNAGIIPLLKRRGAAIQKLGIRYIFQMAIVLKMAKE